MIKLLLFIFSGLAMVSLSAQTYPQYDQAPMTVAPDISGGFCVMRAHHFHLGLDFRTQRKEGWNIYAIEKGWIKRIKISHYGYGLLIQVQHPDGYVSHYGHLSGYGAGIAEYVRNIQYEKQSWEIEVFPKPNEIPVFKGQVIGYSGNTGGSQGPHLHFEIRDSTNNYVYNPLLFGVKIQDTKAPKLKGLRLYSGGKSPVNYDVKVNKYGAMYMSSSTLYASDWWKLAYKAVDPQNGSGFNNSVYHTQLFVDDELAFEFKLDKMRIDDQRSSDYHMDYEYWVDHADYYEKLFLEESNAELLSIYTKGLKARSSSLSSGNHKIKLRLADYYKNTTEFSFTLNFTPDYTDDLVGPPDIKWREEYKTYTPGGDVTIIIPKNTLYYDIQNAIKPTITSTTNEIGEINFSFGTKYIPVRYPYSIEVKTNHYKIPQDKLCVVYYQKDGKMKYYNPVSSTKNSITVEVKDMGSFSVWCDTTKPVISKMSVKDSFYVMHHSKIFTYATDNLSSVHKYNAYIDGKWELTSYEYKEDLLTTQLPATLSPGPHTFEMEVMDERKNKAYKKITIFVTTNEADLALNKRRK
jgi:hypothetical protein